jgi:monoamine oxidase
MPKTCVVIGAGLAGLAAAFQLRKKKWDVIVVDARDRIGGRVFTYRFREAPNLYCELGGEWVGKQHQTIHRLCRHFRLDLIPHLFDCSFAEQGKIIQTFPAGVLPFSAQSKAAFREVKREFEKNAENTQWQEAFDKDDWWTILESKGFTRQDLLRRDLMDSTDFGESIRQVGGYSAASEYLDPETSNNNDEMDSRIEGGNTRLVNALARAIGLSSFYTSHRVTAVVEEKAKISVSAVDTRADEFEAKSAGAVTPREFFADACICTVPARVLLDIDFSPPLRPDKIAAARQLQYARIMKSVILFDQRFWLRRKNSRFSCFTDGVSDFIFDSTLLQKDMQGRGILCSYAIGDKADDLAACGDNSLQKSIQADLAAIFPDQRTNPIAIYRYAWQEDRYTQGAYALYRPGQWFTLREPLSKPHGKVHFAGEHIADEQGFMDGAAQSGEDAASEVLH